MSLPLLLDEGLPFRAAELLRSAGWEVRHVHDLGLTSAGDARVLAAAVEHGAVVVCLDSDFHQLLARTGADKPSVIRIRFEPISLDSWPAIMKEVFDVAEEMLNHGAVVSVTRDAVRGRRLPLRH